MTRTLLKLITLALILIGVFSCTLGNPKEKGIDVVNKLDELGYFKYADPDKKDDLRLDLINSFDKVKALSTIADNETFLPYDHRLYFCDGEALFEIGGIEEYLEYAKHAFEKRGLKLVWSNEISEQNGDDWTHRITVNGKEYVVFEGSMDREDIWGIAQLNFYRLVNDQLELQGSDERVYPISGGHDGEFVFLTDELFNYISSNFYQGKGFRKWDIPYSVDKWKEVSGLE